jgi:hypothetical protein
LTKENILWKVSTLNSQPLIKINKQIKIKKKNAIKEIKKLNSNYQNVCSHGNKNRKFNCGVR